MKNCCLIQTFTVQIRCLRSNMFIGIVDETVRVRWCDKLLIWKKKVCVVLLNMFTDLYNRAFTCNNWSSSWWACFMIVYVYGWYFLTQLYWNETQWRVKIDRRRTKTSRHGHVTFLCRTVLPCSLHKVSFRLTNKLATLANWVKVICSIVSHLCMVKVFNPLNVS